MGYITSGTRYVIDFNIINRPCNVSNCEATPEEREAYEKMMADEEAKMDVASKQKLPPGIKLYIESSIKKIEEHISEDEEILKQLEMYKKLYPYKGFGINALKESIGYSMDTVNNLKRLMDEK